MTIDTRIGLSTLVASAMLVAGAATLAPTAAAPAAVAAPAPPPGDPVRGAKLFLQCRACHTVGAADRSGVGPNLFGVVGAKAGAKPGYTFSPAMLKSGVVWNAATLDRVLVKPRAAVPGTRMAFAGVAAAQNRADLIAYMATLRAKKR